MLLTLLIATFVIMGFAQAEEIDRGAMIESARLKVRERLEFDASMFPSSAKPEPKWERPQVIRASGDVPPYLSSTGV